MTWKEACDLVGVTLPPERKGYPKAGRSPAEHGQRTSIDWAKVEDDYVWGSDIKLAPDGSFERQFPTLRSLGQKYETTVQLVHYHAKRGKWQERRVFCQGKTRDEVKKHLDSQRAKAAAGETVDALDVLDKWIVAFKKGLESGTVRAMNMSDLNTAVRLRAFLKGEAESRAEQKVVHSLDELTTRHLAMRQRAIVSAGPLAGELPPGDEPTPEDDEGTIPAPSPMGTRGDEALEVEVVTTPLKKALLAARTKKGTRR